MRDKEQQGSESKCIIDTASHVVTAPFVRSRFVSATARTAPRALIYPLSGAVFLAPSLHPIMSDLPVDAIQSLADQHPKPPNVLFQYGTAGFRTL